MRGWLSPRDTSPSGGCQGTDPGSPSRSCHLGHLFTVRQMNKQTPIGPTGPASFLRAAHSVLLRPRGGRPRGPHSSLPPWPRP